MTNEDFKKSNQHQRNPWDGVRNDADDSFESNEIVDFDNFSEFVRIQTALNSTAADEMRN